MARRATLFRLFRPIDLTCPALPGRDQGHATRIRRLGFTKMKHQLNLDARLETVMNRDLYALVVVSIILLFSVGTSVDAQAQAPPLFPKHRRGIYTNRDNIEVIDATPQSPPLEIDDPSVPDKGEYEINFFTNADLSNDVRRVNLLFVDANYGIVPKLNGHELPTQVKFEFPIAATKVHGNPFTLGIGAATFGMKFNFYNDERRGVRVS